MISLSAQRSDSFTAAIRHETSISQDILILGPFADKPILESQSTAALEL